ncbi:hypothetical protein [Salipiger abyssi]|uniref:hypothetical protein n=1 Tax=Salipiger abyssi TaxID=1250539 RepID=UPI000975E37C|nr:hypothetical protein [Salipiger abyssi]
MTRLADFRPAACWGLALVTVAATPLAAADYEVAGTATAVIDGESFDLWVPYDAENDESYAKKIVVGPTSTVSIEAFSGEPGESWEDPGVALSISGPQARSTITSLSVTLPDDPPQTLWEFGTGDTSRVIESAEVQRDDDHVAFSITATLTQVDYMGEPVSDGGAGPATMQVSIEGEADLTE